MKKAGLSLIKAVSDHFFLTFRDTPELAGPPLAPFYTWKQVLRHVPIQLLKESLGHNT